MNHPFLGPKDVDMVLDPSIYGRVSSWPFLVEDDEIMIHYTVTEACPFNCRGCINALTSGVNEGDRGSYHPEKKDEGDPERDAKGISQLIKLSGKKQAVIVFYGGEPMLRLERMPCACPGATMRLMGASKKVMANLAPSERTSLGEPPKGRNRFRS